MQRGIDVARYQGRIDWERVKAAGVDFAMLRAVSTARELYIDPTFERNYAECRRLGIPVGVYYYTCARTEETARRELALLYQVIRGKKFDYPVTVDAEDGSLRRLSRQALTDLVLLALKTIESWDCYAMLYTYTAFAAAALDMTRLAAYDLWIADYRGRRPDSPHGMWQFSSRGQVPGIAGRTDLDLAYRDYPAIIRAAGLNGWDGEEKTPLYRIQLGWISSGDYRAAEEALRPVLRERELEAYYKVEEEEEWNWE